MIKIDPTSIREKFHMSQDNGNGLKARVDFIQKIKYEAQLNSKIHKCINNIVNDPHNNYGELKFLCDKYGSDKGSNYYVASNKVHPYSWLPHTYADIYEVLFRDLRIKAKNIFECGIGTDNENIEGNMTSKGKPGASLRVWRDYFPNAMIYGADIDKICLFSENKIETAYIDQTSPKTIKSFFENLNLKFDIIIDDGLHNGNAALCLFQNSIEYLAESGIYCIEDLPVGDIESIQDYFKNKLELYIVKYMIMNTPDSPYNNMIVIQKRPQTLAAVERE